MHLTKELHILRAHLVHYESLLEDFRKSVVFLVETLNMPGHDQNQENSASLMKKECNDMLSEIERLKMSRQMQDMRLSNVINLVRVKLMILSLVDILVSAY